MEKEEMIPTHRLKKSWRLDPVESFGRGSFVHVIKRKKLPDIVCFLGKKAHQLGCAYYDIDINGLEESLEEIV